MSAARQLVNHDYEVPYFLQVNKSKSQRKAPSRVIPAIMLFVVMMILFSMLVLVVYRYALIAETKYSIFTLKKEIKELSMKKGELHFQIETSVALDNIEKISTEQLGMSYPNQGQMIYIEAAKGYNLAVARVLESEPAKGHESDFLEKVGALAARFKR